MLNDLLHCIAWPSQEVCKAKFFTLFKKEFREMQSVQQKGDASAQMELLSSRKPARLQE